MFKALPSGSKLKSVGEDPARAATVFVVESGQFKEVQPGQEIPEITAWFIKDAAGKTKFDKLDMSKATGIPCPITGTVNMHIPGGGIHFIPISIDVGTVEEIDALNDAVNCDCGTTSHAHHINCPAHPTNKVEIRETCPECEGSGFIPKLLPTGHTEAKCEACDGSGEL